MVKGELLVQKRPKQGEALQCIAASKSGKRCTARVHAREEGEEWPIPWCDAHMRTGDGAVKRGKHPRCGDVLVARMAIPKGYRLVYWGRRDRCPRCDKEDRCVSFYPMSKHTGERSAYNGVINPGGTDDVMQFASCPGPNELCNMRSTDTYYGQRNGELCGLEFVTTRPIAPNEQLTHWYGPGWFKVREIKRTDVGTKRYPAPRREPTKKAKTSPGTKAAAAQ